MVGQIYCNDAALDIEEFEYKQSATIVNMAQSVNMACIVNMGAQSVHLRLCEYTTSVNMAQSVTGAQSVNVRAQSVNMAPQSI